ncbi:MAG: hypothetical protein KDD61_04625 [Bdellovibrionales bacterium]|nr:hypothetical protein [Bdellovibrionales bacterium]
MTEKVYLDSSLGFYGAGNIGYRWAVKVINAVSGRFVHVNTDCFFFLDLMDQHYYQNDFQGINTHFQTFQKILPRVEAVTVADFDQSYLLFKEYPNASPRLLLVGAIMKRLEIRKIVTTFSSGMEKFSFFERTNLMTVLNEMKLSRRVLEK